MLANRTIQAYDRYADVYDQEVIDFWEQFPKDFLGRFRDTLPGQDVLNVGSGTGRDSILLRDFGLHVSCIDGSATMVAMTAALGFDSRQADFLDMSLSPESFDGVWAYTSLIHLAKTDAVQVLRALHSALRPGGALVFGAIEGEAVKMVTRDTMPGEERFFAYYTNSEMEAMTSDAGFRLVHSQEYQPHNSVYLNHLYIKQ